MQTICYSWDSIISAVHARVLAFAGECMEVRENGGAVRPSWKRMIEQGGRMWADRRGNVILAQEWIVTGQNIC